MKKKKSLKENIITLTYAILAAVFIRSFFFEPFSIPSGSMYPTLEVGDYLFVSKYDYGFSKHSLPLSIPLIPKRIFYSEPKRGDVIVFKTPEDNKTDYIKRVIGIPGDEIRMESSSIYVNKQLLKKKKIGEQKYKNLVVERFLEVSPNGKEYEIFEIKEKNPFIDTDNFNTILVPKNQFFVLGDNRDNSQDSRFIGAIPKKNLVGKGRIVFLSFDTNKTGWLTFWNWPKAFRKERFLYSLVPDDHYNK